MAAWRKRGYCYPSRLEKTLLSSIAHSMICTRLFRGKMHSDWFNGIEILQGRWQHGEEVGHCYPSGLEKTLCKWDVYVPLVTKRFKKYTQVDGKMVRDGFVTPGE